MEAPELQFPHFWLGHSRCLLLNTLWKTESSFNMPSSPFYLLTLKIMNKCSDHKFSWHRWFKKTHTKKKNNQKNQNVKMPSGSVCVCVEKYLFSKSQPLSFLVNNCAQYLLCSFVSCPFCLRYYPVSFLFFWVIFPLLIVLFSKEVNQYFPPRTHINPSHQKISDVAFITILK